MLARLPAWAGYVLLACGYFLLARLGYLLLDPDSGVAIWWPPAGLYLAALVLAPRRRWPLVVLAMLPAAVLGSVLRGRPLEIAAWFFVGNTLEAVAAAWLVLRAAGPRPSASTIRGAVALATLPALAAAMSLALHQGAALASGRAPSEMAWLFWGGSSLGALLVAPLLLALAERPERIRPTPRRAAELAGLCAALALALLTAAAAQGPLPWAHEVAVVLPLLWAALRFGVRGATLSLALVAVATVRLGAAGPAVAGAQFLLAVLAVAVLLVAAAAEERRRATRELARSRDLLDAFFARSPTGMFIKDDQLRAVVVSRNFARLLGVTADESLGRTIEEAIPGPEGRRILALERAALAGGTAVEQEIRLHDRTFLYVLFPIPWRGGAPYLGGVAVEVTDRVRAETALRASDERLRLIETALDQSSDAVSVFDEDARHVWVNSAAARLVGLPKERLVGATLFDVVPGVEPAAWRARCEETAVRGVVIREQPVRAGSGRIFPAETASLLIQFGGRRYFVVSVRDVSDRRRAEESARLAGIGTLAAGVAHEINNPLAYVVSNLAWLREQLDAGAGPAVVAEAQQVIGEAQDGALRVRDIVQQLRLFARPDETVGRVDVRSAARSAIAIVQNELRHRAALVTRFAEDVPAVIGNENRLAQVFLNLLTNAAQAIPAGHADREAIRVEIRAAGDAVVAEVSDTGRGIPQADRARIFEPFFTTKAVGAGTGLGLYICHEIVSGMGGRIEVESEPGAGSTFRVVLPAAAAAAAAGPAEASVEGAKAVRRGRVLVLDDDERVASALGRILERDHAVDVATDARAALERVRAGERWDVVFCDLMMPDMTGMEWFEQVRALAPALADAVVFVTGGAFTQAASDFLERARNARLEKPFTPADVRALVAARLAA